MRRNFDILTCGANSFALVLIITTYQASTVKHHQAEIPKQQATRKVLQALPTLRKTMDPSSHLMAPLSAKTPTSLFGALALSPSLASTFPLDIPALTLLPPTPSPSTSLFFHFSAFDSDSDTSYSSDSGSNSELSSDLAPTERHRPLSPNEARQITLLLSQTLFPLRHSEKLLMCHAIELAEKLHLVGVRWDKRRRVMGMHLRGIWEEGGKVGGGGMQ